MLKAAMTALALSAMATPLALAEAPATEEAASATLLTAKVNGMVCDFCAQAVTAMFGKDEAVDGIHVDLDSGEIHVMLKAGASMSDARVEELVTKSGYDLVEVSRVPA
ncbi:MAG: hypothetical protein MRY64_11190 [Hyphomonadaceae bacterium]|nr:hypothetical protein [Hyphomonadaceae bacterium]